jgi:hypothetical protein
MLVKVLLRYALAPRAIVAKGTVLEMVPDCFAGPPGCFLEMGLRDPLFIFMENTGATSSTTRDALLAILKAAPWGKFLPLDG